MTRVYRPLRLLALLAPLVLLDGLACRSPGKYDSYEFFSSIEAHDKVCGDCHELYAADFFPPDEWYVFLKKHPKDDRPKPEIMDGIIEYVLQEAQTSG